MLRCLVSGLFLLYVICGCEKEKPGAEQRDEGKGVGMSVTVQWLGHASFRISAEGVVIYIDPWKLSEAARDATVVLVSHSHYDHYSAEDVAKVMGPDTRLMGPADVIGQEGRGQAIERGHKVVVNGVSIAAVASYNPDKQFHPKANDWLGFVVEIGSKRIYYAGDTDLTTEMKALTDIDVALLPVGGTYTMGAEEAAAAVEHIKPGRLRLST
ncbi:MAG: MBL fold metallo-hydrolase [Planctomycetota bacterium]|jgi:L-ascorbate metabolism protein UlaG (beta-lactamase superfamily)